MANYLEKNLRSIYREINRTSNSLNSVYSRVNKKKQKSANTILLTPNP